MSSVSTKSPYQWECQPQAEALILNALQESCRVNPQIRQLSDRLLHRTSTRLFDWLDHIVVSSTEQTKKQLGDTGFVVEYCCPEYTVYSHPGAQLARVVVRKEDTSPTGIAVKVDSIADFLMVHGLSRCIEGSPFSGYRRSCVETVEGVALWVVERRIYPKMEPEPAYTDEALAIKYIKATEMWQTRPRDLEDEEAIMKDAYAIAEEMISSLGKDLAAWVVLECERKYWQSRNGAGQVQKNRQDRLGMGWANHDHHTFRSSRKHFSKLVGLFEMLGFHCRERFYAGKDAGWGAQVMENPRCGLVLFLDLDLTPEEIKIDFAHHQLPEIPSLGTVGLWCALHGDSILKAGMHHLEAQFMFEELTQDLSGHGVGMMDPFSNFPYLKQAFTHGEVWDVNPDRVRNLAASGKITQEQAEKFLKYGAVGSHLENLQRREGYKGFNKNNVSTIILKTDPRNFEA